MNGKLIAALAAMLVLLGFVGLLTFKAFTQPVAPEVVPTQVEPSDEVVPTPSSIVVETDPPGATITLDGKAKGSSPVTLSESKAGEHVIEAALPGRQSVKRTVTVKAEGEQVMMVLSLPALVAQLPDKVPDKPVANDPPKTPGDVKRPEAAARGRLTLNTDPWTHVSLNGKALGDTPLIEASLPAGRHQLRLTNEKENVDLTIEVDIKPGQVTKKVLRL